MNSYGKKFEYKLKQDWLKVQNSDITRLYDPTNGFKSISNVSDFIGYIYPYIFYLECKSTKGNTFNFKRLTQARKLIEKQHKLGVNSGIIIWFRDHHKVCYVPIEEYVRLKDIGYKSINIRMIEDESFNVFEIPSVSKRTFLDSDYSIMKEIAEQKFNEMKGE